MSPNQPGGPLVGVRERYRPARSHSGSSGKSVREDTLALARSWRLIAVLTMTRLADRRTTTLGAATANVAIFVDDAGAHEQGALTKAALGERIVAWLATHLAGT